MSTATEVREKGRRRVRLLCPICNTLNGSWDLDFAALQKSGKTVKKRKRHRVCGIRLLYKAIKEPHGKVSVTVTMDAKAKADLSRFFRVGVEDVEAVIAEVLRDQQDRGIVDVE